MSLKTNREHSQCQGAKHREFEVGRTSPVNSHLRNPLLAVSTYRNQSFEDQGVSDVLMIGSIQIHEIKTQ